MVEILAWCAVPLAIYGSALAGKGLSMPQSLVRSADLLAAARVLVVPLLHQAPAVKPLLVDLFCGAGGATRGYEQAGFRVLGVDHRPQPRYVGDEFVQADALDWLAAADLSGVVAIHASPPCQRFTALAGLYRPAAAAHPDLLTPTLALLATVGVPWVVENVPGAPLRSDLVLCGEMFGLRVRRHRWFQTSPLLYWLMPPCRHDTTPVGVYGHPGGTSGRAYRRSRGDLSYSRRASLADWKQAMGIDWMSGAELSQAIPPAYTHHIGAQLIEQVASVTR